MTAGEKTVMVAVKPVKAGQFVSEARTFVDHLGQARHTRGEVRRLRWYEGWVYRARRWLAEKIAP